MFPRRSVAEVKVPSVVPQCHQMAAKEGSNLPPHDNGNGSTPSRLNKAQKVDGRVLSSNATKDKKIKKQKAFKLIVKAGKRLNPQHIGALVFFAPPEFDEKKGCVIVRAKEGIPVEQFELFADTVTANTVYSDIFAALGAKGLEELRSIEDRSKLFLESLTIPTEEEWDELNIPANWREDDDSEEENCSDADKWALVKHHFEEQARDASAQSI